MPVLSCSVGGCWSVACFLFPECGNPSEKQTKKSAAQLPASRTGADWNVPSLEAQEESPGGSELRTGVHMRRPFSHVLPVRRSEWGLLRKASSSVVLNLLWESKIIWGTSNKYRCHSFDSIKVSWNGPIVQSELRITALVEDLNRKENLRGNERCHYVRA